MKWSILEYHTHPARRVKNGSSSASKWKNRGNVRKDHMKLKNRNKNVKGKNVKRNFCSSSRKDVEITGLSGTLPMGLHRE